MDDADADADADEDGVFILRLFWLYNNRNINFYENDAYFVLQIAIFKTRC